MSGNNTSVDLSCFEQFNNDRYVAVVAIRAVAGVISIIGCLCTITLIFLLKKHVFFTQRLILYLAISTLAYSLLSVLNVQGYKAYESESLQGYCVFMGFLEQFVSWWIPLAITCIVVDLSYKVIFNRASERLEIPYLVFIFASPILSSWIPFIYLAYGQAGAWCWIRDTSYDDCSNRLDFGTVLKFVLYWVPVLLIMIFLTILLVVIAIILRRKRREWSGKFDPEAMELKKRMHKEVLPLISYPIIYLLLNVFPFINRIANIATTDTYFVLWLLAAVSLPLQGLVITIAFVADPETRSKLTYHHLIGTIRNISDGKGEVEEFHLDKSESSKEKEIEHSYSTYANSEL